MSPAQAFLNAILNRPEDDAPRLVFTDWLEEHGEPARAEFIRVQCELARLPEADDRRAELTARERRLNVAHSRHWCGDLHYFRFRRGFVERLLFWEPMQFVERAAEVCAAHPIGDLWVSTEEKAGWGPALAATPQLSRLHTLRMPAGRSHSFTASDLLVVVRSPHLTGLAALDIGCGNQINDRSFAALVGAGRRQRPPALRSLRRLATSESRLTDVAVRSLLASPLARTLTHLDLSHNEAVTPAGLRALHESTLWRRLEEANLGWLHLDTVPDYAALAGALAQSRLRRLSLAGLSCRTRTAARLARALAGAPSWGELRGLELSWLCLTGAGIKALASCPHLAGLSRLDLEWCDLNAGDLRALAASPHARNLTGLKLAGNLIDDEGVTALAESPSVTRLTYLDLGGTGVTDAGVRALARSPNFAHLRVLNLHGCVGNAGLRALAASPHMRRLTTLWINAAGGVTDAGAAALARSEQLPCLSYLDLHARLTRKGQQALLEAKHIAWPSVYEDDLKTEELRERYRARFDRAYVYDIGWDEPFSWTR